jgi:hypothetical protein
MLDTWSRRWIIVGIRGGIEKYAKVVLKRLFWEKLRWDRAPWDIENFTRAIY